MAYYPYATQFTARYELSAPSGQIAVFNDPFDANYVGALVEVSGLDSPEVRESADDLVEGDGGVHGNFYFGRRPIVLNGKVFGHASIAERDIRLDRARRSCLALRTDGILKWKPAVRYENLITRPRFGGPNNIATLGTHWSQYQPVAGGTINSNGVFAFSTGSNSGYRTRFTNAADTTSRSIGIISSYMPISPGETYNFGADFEATDVAASTNGVRTQIFWYTNNTGTASSTPSHTSATTDDTLNTRTRVTQSAVAPSDARCARVAIYATTNTASDVLEHMYGDFVFTPGVGTTTALRDGHTAGYYWQGNADESASGDFIEMFTTVRRNQAFRENGQWVKEFQIPLVSEYAVFFSTGLKTSLTTQTSENRGSYPAYPIFRITGASTNPTVTVAPPSGSNMVFRTTNLSLAAGEAVDFDMLTHTGVFTAGARVGQSANRYIDFALSVFPTFNTGNSVATLAGGGTLLTSWRDTWV